MIVGMENKLIDELYQSVKALGVDMVTDVLKKARSENLSINDPNIDFVVNAVTSKFRITTEEMIFSQNKSNKRQLAIAFCVFYLHNSFGYNFSDLKLIFKRHKSQLSRANSKIKKGIDVKDAFITKMNDILSLEVNSRMINIKNKQDGKK